ncbi:MAG TPA: DUF6734 family protein, partial [Gelidibacter sp.]|uniref:DUF6734 family protein n=1 Tax=Gelidibacter sp. TaxID=2018083 RepID=UPI002BE69065
MNIIQSFWSKNVNCTKDSSGWLAPRFHWLSWILSSHQLIKYHDNVHLYTDEFGKKLLIDDLKLPYTKVHVILDELNYYNKNLWAIGKIKTYHLQKEPFIHVDGDVFVWEKIDRLFKKSPLLAQNLEVTTDYYKSMWANISPNLDFLPPEIERFENGSNTHACNMGIVGGNDLSFFHDYCAKSFEFVDKNKRVWETAGAYNFNVFFEQVLFYEMATNRELKIDFLLDEKTLDNNYRGFGDFDKVPIKKYLHLIGQYKRNH